MRDLSYTLVIIYVQPPSTGSRTPNPFRYIFIIENLPYRYITYIVYIIIEPILFIIIVSHNKIEFARSNPANNLILLFVHVCIVTSIHTHGLIYYASSNTYNDSR